MRDSLEDLLAGRGGAAEQAALARHLASCAGCSSELDSMKGQSEMLRSLRAPEEMLPAPGFYARVLQRIEERAKDSMWSVLIYSPFAKPLVYASLTLALMLGSYVITQESRDGHLGSDGMVAQQFQEGPLVIGSQAQQRDAVLANFVLHQGSPQ